MKLVRPLLPCHLAAVLTACGSMSSSSGAHIVIDKSVGWSGTAEVLVHAPDGSLTWRAAVNNSADVSIDDGDTVSVALHDANKVKVVSAMGVVQGDALEVPAYPLATSYVATTVNLPAVSGAAQWEAATPSSWALDPALPISVQVPADDATVPIVAAAESFDSVLAVYGATDAPIDANQSITFTSQLAWEPVTVTMQNPGAYTEVAGSLDIEDGSLTLPALGNTVAVPTSFGVAMDVGAVSFSSSMTEQDLAGQTFGDPPTGSVTVDLSLPDLPAIGAATVANGQASWTATGGGTYDLISLELGTGAASAFSWTLRAAPGTTSVVLPQLPSDLGAPATFAQTSVTASERSDVDGYDDALRAMPLPQPGARWEMRTVSNTAPTSAAPRGVHRLAACGRIPFCSQNAR